MTAARRRLLALVTIFGMMVALGLLGAIIIDQGRGVVSGLAAISDQALKVRGAALSVEAARRLALEGNEASASKAMAEAAEALVAVKSNETTAQRQARIGDALALAERFSAGFAPEAGRQLAGALAELDLRQTRDVLEADVLGESSILNAASLYVVLLIIVVGLSAGAALIGFRDRA